MPVWVAEHVDRAVAEADVLTHDPALPVRHLRHDLEPVAAEVRPHAELLVHDAQAVP